MSNQSQLIVTCFNCLGQYDLITAPWCSCEKRGPTKVCPYCYRCFCDYPSVHQEQMWKGAPTSLMAERDQLAHQRMARKKTKQEQIYDMFELPRKAYTIMVVEDDPSLMRLMVKLLKSYFLNPLSATDGKEALKIIDEHLIHLIILDIMVPELNGFQICKRMKENPSTRHIPIVVTSGRTTVTDKIKGFVLGVDDYLTKPFQTTELIIRILNLLRKTYLH